MNNAYGAAWLRDVVERAQPLWGRPAQVIQSAILDSDAPHREHWARVLGGEEALSNRIYNAGVTGIGDNDSTSNEDPPIAWEQVLASVVPIYINATHLGDKAHLEYQSRELPFRQLFYGFLLYGRQELRRISEPHLLALSPWAIHAIEQQLEAHLTFISSLAIGRDFSLFRFCRAPASAFEQAWSRTKPSSALYREYIDHMLHGGMLDLIHDYPVLARLLCQSTSQWIRNNAVFLHHYAEDFPKLGEIFGFECMPFENSIGSIRQDLSDRHCGGKTVAEVELSTGKKLIYKPRGLKPELSFFQFVSLLNNLGDGPQLRSLSVLDCSDHGWMEFAEAHPCKSIDGVRAYYSRIGGLLAVCQVLAITDLHFENIVACGDSPIIVDLETILDDHSVPDYPGGRSWSITTCGLLPRWQVASDGHHFDLSGLCADSTQDAGIRRLAWLYPNTDQMHLTDISRLATSEQHRPRVGVKPSAASEFVPEILDGFRSMYLHLMSNRARILTEETTSHFDNLDLRVLIRGTSTYCQLQLRLLHPEFLADGIARSLELEWLARPMSGTSVPQPARKVLYQKELAAMERLDVPRFGSSSWSSLDLFASDAGLSFISARRDSKVLARRLAQLSYDDLEVQLGLIEVAIRERFDEPVTA